jgi:prolyl-tRNA synthetase
LMRVTEMYAPTLREWPAEAEIASHRLMLRAGLMRKLVSGVYSYLPLGYRVIRKVEQIVREEMDRQGGLEILMSALQPAELWKASGRWTEYGPEMFKLQDRAGREFCLGPTHEEIFTSLIRDEVRSYRQLPLLLYQIQTKYRDEIRPRFGLVRAREFIMKDLYSFDRDEEGLDVSYRKMYEAYSRVFTRCGISYMVVEADVGAMGGTDSHEFVIVTEVGEADLVYCKQCGYAANVERAECMAPAESPATELKPLEKVATPDMRTIDEVSGFLGVSPKELIKTLVYVADGKPVAALVRGDRDLNEAKLKRVLGVAEVELADEETIRRVTGAPVGFAGPVGIAVDRIIADLEVGTMINSVVGGNAKDLHLRNANVDRDFRVDTYADLRNAVEGDPCPKCMAPLSAANGTEVGHIFKLGTKYSAALGARYLDENGQEHPIIMGSYGIGITRTVAAIIESNHDEDGIIWPMSVAPYHAVVVPINVTEEEQMAAATDLYEKLEARGVEVVLDDRNERPGVKFKDADLIGYPIRIVVSQKGLLAGQVEVKRRRSGTATMVDIADVPDHVASIIAEELASLVPR